MRLRRPGAELTDGWIVFMLVTAVLLFFVLLNLVVEAGTPSEGCCHELSERMETVERHIDAAWDKEGKYRFGQLEGASNDMEFMVRMRGQLKKLEERVKELEDR